MGIGWQVTRGLFGASTSASRHLANNAARQTASRQANRGSRAVNRGLVGPWDPVPAGAATFADFSGLATPGDITLEPWIFPLGRYVLPKGKNWKPREEIGIGPETANRHTVVYAPTQSGKTTSIIAPWIYSAMDYGYFVVALDIKGNGDLLQKVQEYAASLGPLPDVAISNFDYTDPRASVSWNWISDLEDDSAIEAAATALVGRDRDNDPNREFRLRDLKWVRGLLEFAVETGQPWTVGNVLALLDDQERFARLVTNIAPARARMRLSDLVYLPEHDYYAKVQFVTTYFEMLNHPGFNRVTERPSLKLRDVDGEAGLLVVTAPLADDRLSEAVSGLFLSQLINAQMKKFNTNGRPVLLVLDEAPRLKERLNLPQLMATSASSGMSVLLAIQEVSEFDEKERHAVLSNCATHILLGGAGAPTTDFFGDRIGRRIASRATHSSNWSRDGRAVQTGFESHEVPVLGRNEMAHPPGKGYSALVHGYDLSPKPILVDLTRADLASGG